MLFSICLFTVFFFKQKTAYEVRISDWSSDVCSSDLPNMTGSPLKRGLKSRGVSERCVNRSNIARKSTDHLCPNRQFRCVSIDHACGKHSPFSVQLARLARKPACERSEIARRCHPRSEEQPSELQSLNRNSYAVFCSKKKKTTRNT